MTKKKEEEKIEFPEIYTVVGADLSLTRPGFAVFEMKEGIPKLIKCVSVDNKTKKNKTHGQILHEIERAFCDEVFPIDMGMVKTPLFLVREKEIMHMKVPSERSVTKTVGVMDLLAYMIFILFKDKKKFDGIWHEIYPVTVKKLITGSGKAEKSEVADALEHYVGKQEYKCDDESDAVAVVLAWLIQQGQIKQKEIT